MQVKVAIIRLNKKIKFFRAIAKPFGVPKITSWFIVRKECTCMLNNTNKTWRPQKKTKLDSQHGDKSRILWMR